MNVTATHLSFLKFKPQYQTSPRSGLSLRDYIVEQNVHAELDTRLALTNNISDSYVYYDSSFQPTNQSNSTRCWDFGSMLCESSHIGLCDKLMTRPDEGCSGPGCGANSWQDADLKCHQHSDFSYDPIAREQADYVWPESMYGKYYSTCNPDVEIQGERNCRYVNHNFHTQYRSMKISSAKIVMPLLPSIGLQIHRLKMNTLVWHSLATDEFINTNKLCPIYGIV